MTSPGPGSSESGAVQIALELERMRRSIDVGFTKTDGALALLVARSDRTEEDIRQLRLAYEADVRDLRTEVEILKKGRWPLPALGALTGVAGLVLALMTLLQR